MNGRLVCLLAAFAVVLTGTAAAQSTAPASQDGTHYMRLASLFGESDEEKAQWAAQQQHDANLDAQINDLKQRVYNLEQSLQQATGQNEQLTHQIQELSARIDQQKNDFDLKLCGLAAQQLGAGTAPDASGNGLPCNPGQAVSAIIAPSGPAVAAAPAAPGQPAPPATDHSQYDQAMGLLAKAQYDQARAAFRAYADANPNDELTPLAVYWVGDIAYVQKDYAGASQAFVEQIKKYPTSLRGPDSMLKLGQSLEALGQKKEGCLTLGAIKSKYPQASALVLSQAASARATAQCK